MTKIKELSSQVEALFRILQKTRPHNSLEAFHQAQLAIGNVIQALDGTIPKEKVIKAIGDAKSPNAVSRAVRHNLPPL